ncbi:MAG: PH domain-containing protein [Anaerococcus vaginalis]
MNDGTNIASDDIILKPKFRYWLMKNFLLITLAIFVFIFSKYIREHELLKFISGTILVLLIFIIFYRYISMLLCTKWIITREQIKIYQGVLSKRINYIELYRVYDYEEKQSFIQSLINNTNIYIYSGDKSTPELLMNGLKANSDIIQTIRNRVEEQKKKKEYMNLQTDNDMKRVLLFFSLMLLLGNIKGLAQSIVIDPAMIGTLVYSHQAQQGVLKDIQSEETKIRNFQILIQQKMSQIQSLQEKTYNYLSTVNAVVKNGKDIIYASTLARDIAKYQSEAAKYAVGDPKLLTIIAKTEYELISRSVDLMIYINNIALQGGEKNLMDNKQRIDLCIHVVNELRRMRGLAYAVCRQMKSAKRAGVLKTLVPGQFKYVNSGKQKVDNILNGIKWISKGGY